MRAAISLQAAVRDLVARRLLNPSDRLVVCIRRDGIGACLFKWTFPLAAEAELWGDEFPEADSDGLPAHDQHRAILAILRAKRPRKVASIAAELGLDAAQLYRGPGDLKLLVTMGLIEKAAEGYRLTAKGVRVAALLPGDEDE